MANIIIIPARYASTRFPGKALAPLVGATGQEKSLIRRSWDAANQVKNIDKIVIATDDIRIKDHAESFGADVIMTSSKCENGTERCAEALDKLGADYDIVVNLQGDAPLTPPWFIESLINELSNHPTAEIATPVLRCDHQALAQFQADRKAGRVGGTTVVFDANNRALYFSKEVIPYSADLARTSGSALPVFHHVGVYAYRPSALAAYSRWKPGVLENLEGLEQLRFLERNHPILCVLVEAKGREFWELNNPEDADRIEKILAKRMVA